MYLAHYVAQLNQMQDTLTADLVKAGKQAGLVAIVFANAKKPFVQNEILPLVDYWNYRSGQSATFFFVGYLAKDPGDDGSESAPGPKPEESFRDRAFVEMIGYFEGNSEWKYRGDTPLILCRGFLRDVDTSDGPKPKAFFDLKSILEFELESALREDAIKSVESFFELLIEVAKETPGDNVQWKLSDKLGTGALGDAIIEALNDKLKGVKRIVDAVRFFRIKNDRSDGSGGIISS
jgi:hypothetical protein